MVDNRRVDPVDAGVDQAGIIRLLERRDECRDKRDFVGMKQFTEELRDMFNVVVDDKNRSWCVVEGASRRPVRKPDVLTIEAEKPVSAPAKPSKPAFATNETRLRALAEAERARRAQGQETAPSKRNAAPPRTGAPPKTLPKPPPSAASAASKTSRPPTAKEDGKDGTTEQKRSQVVKVYTDGHFDLKLSSGEIIEHVGPEWLERLRIDKADALPPPPTASSRPPTGLSCPPTASSRPPTGLSRPPTGQSQRPPTSGTLTPAFVAATSFEGPRAGWVFKCGTQGLGYYQEAADKPATLPAADLLAPKATSQPQTSTNENAAPTNESTGKPATPAVVNLAAMVDLDDTLAGLGRKGGRSNLGAMRAAKSEMSSLLAWS